MNRHILYFILFMISTPLISSGKVWNVQAGRASGPDSLSRILVFTELDAYADSGSVKIIPGQEPGADRKRIKEIPKAEHKSKPEKVTIIRPDNGRPDIPQGRHDIPRPERPPRPEEVRPRDIPGRRHD